MFIESIMHCVIASYTIVNHNSVELLGTPLLYELCNMTLSLLDMVIQLFEFMNDLMGKRRKKNEISKI